MSTLNRQPFNERLSSDMNVTTTMLLVHCAPFYFIQKSLHVNQKPTVMMCLGPLEGTQSDEIQRFRALVGSKLQFMHELNLKFAP